MITKDIPYEVDGKRVTGYLADPEKGKRPGVLVCHQGGGLTEHAKERARMLAEIGYVAFALDMYGEVAATREQAMTLLTELTKNPPLLRQRAFAGLDILKAQANVDPARLAAVGYCFGGGVVLWLSMSREDLQAVVAFHPGLNDLPDAPKVHCKVMVCAGVEDPLISPEAREKFIGTMVRAGADWQLITYGNAGHSFTDKSVDQFGMKGFAYHAPTDRRSWSAMRDLFDETWGKLD
jgi:dienelactone hydrolase